MGFNWGIKETFKEFKTKENWKNVRENPIMENLIGFLICFIFILTIFTFYITYSYFSRNEILWGISDKYVTTKNESIKNEIDSIKIKNIFDNAKKENIISKLNDSTKIYVNTNQFYPKDQYILKNEKESFELGDIGDFIGGYFGFLIGLIGALLTFLAFYIQYRANKDVQKQFRLQQFETQFHKMIDVYLNNKDKFSIVGYKNPKNKEITVEGETLERKCNFSVPEIKCLDCENLKKIEFIDYTTRDHIVFQKLIVELKVVYRVFLEAYKEKNNKTEDELTVDCKKSIFQESYKLFFNGLNKYQKLENQITYIILAIDSLKKIRDCHRKTGSKKFKDFYIGKNGENKTLWVKLNYEPFKGYLHFLPQYYRNLYSIVKYVVNENEDINLSEKQKINYLRILRSTLSEYEQTMLFYNWYSSLGSAWEDGNNKFFTEYKMIHNLKKITLIDDEIEIYDILNIKKNLREGFFEAFN